ncbi:hypothetical protein E2542_SST04796 [Spatholobus suberectus]|nr:hypothetical protein E2542_SST04796 [Spatholobus suberectus]
MLLSMVEGILKGITHHSGPLPLETLQGKTVTQCQRRCVVEVAGAFEDGDTDLRHHEHPQESLIALSEAVDFCFRQRWCR